MGKKTLHPLSTNRLREGVGRKTSRGEVGLIHCANSYADSLSISPGGGYDCCMKEMHKHTRHPDLVKRLKRAEGHLRHVIGMIEGEETCLDIARQLAAVESAVTAAKRVLIHDHIDHCLSHDEDSVLAEMKALTRLL